MDRNLVGVVEEFYDVLGKLETIIGGRRTLVNCDGRMLWPRRGVYFFFEPGEFRTTTGSGLRVVRVGTHALSRSSKTTLWDRLRQHRGNIGGQKPGGGNHRGSIFREHIGGALIRNHDLFQEVSGSWGVGSNASGQIRETETPLERSVSEHIRSMPFIWLAVEGEPGPGSLRGYIERNSIALLSNYLRADNPVDPPSESWLGNWAKNSRITRSGLWNSNYVDEYPDGDFLKAFRPILGLHSL